jgi:DNA-binding NtrC family response regulator
MCVSREKSRRHLDLRQSNIGGPTGLPLLNRINRMSTVVVIEEDVAMRTLIREWLEAAGYQVRTPAPNAGGEVDLVVVDIPNLRVLGAQTVHDVRVRYPRAAVVGMSTQLGRSLPGDSAQAVALRVGRLMAKPLARDELLAAVAGAIGLAR